jgi:hypothetical protein
LEEEGEGGGPISIYRRLVCPLAIVWGGDGSPFKIDSFRAIRKNRK